MPIAEGAVFAGYTIQRLLGSGGMGEVYLVQHPRPPRQEALKILPASVSADPDYRQRFAREADIAASLWHPHIVAIHDRGEHDGQLWITMDYVEGTDAARLVRERYPHGMPPKDVLDVVAAIADALDYAHERFLLHRDVKPANILLSDPRKGERRIVLADFGIARGVDDSNGLTATNMTVGSVAYAAPEQLTGKVLDGRADQYALAATAFHLLPARCRSGIPIPRWSSATTSAHRRRPYRNCATISDRWTRRWRQRWPRSHTIDSKLAASSRPLWLAATLLRSGAAPPRSVHTTPRSSHRVQHRHRWSCDAATRHISDAAGVEPEPRRAALISGGVAVALLAVGCCFPWRETRAIPGGITCCCPAPSLTRPVWPETIDPPRTVTRTAPPVTVTQPDSPPPAPPPAPRAPAPALLLRHHRLGDLGLGQPMSRPSPATVKRSLSSDQSPRLGNMPLGCNDLSRASRCFLSPNRPDMPLAARGDRGGQPHLCRLPTSRWHHR